MLLDPELARGNYIQYLDADDTLAPDTLARRVAALEATRADKRLDVRFKVM
jgi:Glycosyl transferase family 2